MPVGVMTLRHSAIVCRNSCLRTCSKTAWENTRSTDRDSSSSNEARPRDRYLARQASRTSSSDFAPARSKRSQAVAGKCFGEALVHAHIGYGESPGVDQDGRRAMACREDRGADTVSWAQFQDRSTDKPAAQIRSGNVPVKDALQVGSRVHVAVTEQSKALPQAVSDQGPGKDHLGSDADSPR